MRVDTCIKEVPMMMMMIMMMIIIIIITTTILSSLVLTALYELRVGEEIIAALDERERDTHTHTYTRARSRSVGRLWTRDRFVAEIST
jgi:hypothetical protein